MKTKGVLKRFSSLVLLGLFIFSSFQLKAAYQFPHPTSYKYVNDYASVIDEASARQIINLGYELEQKTGVQAIVVTISTLDSVPIEDYANQLFRSWGIGEADKDNGLLILLSINDRSWRVEVGRGLEGAIPDLLSDQIMQELARPEFIQNNYAAGLTQAYSKFCDTIGTEYNVTLTHSLGVVLPENTTAPIRHRNNSIGVLAIIFVIMDLLFNRGRIFSFILQMLFWNNFFNRGGPRGGSGGGGFGGGSSNGGGSSGKW